MPPSPQREAPPRAAAPANGIAPPAASRQEPRRKVVVAPTEQAHADSMNWVLVILAFFVISPLFHAGALYAIYHIEINSLDAKDKPAGTLNPPTPPPPPEEQQPDKPTVDPKGPDLTELNIGNPEVQGSINFAVDRIEPESVPGEVNIREQHGIVDAPEGSPKDIPPPPGTGGGTGAAPLGFSENGTGSPFGTSGGYGIGTINGGQFAGRSGATKQKLLENGGGNAESEACVASGLNWLALHQCPDGHWSMHEFHKFTRDKPFPAGTVFEDRKMTGQGQKNDVAGTALALLPFLAAGQTHKASKDKQAVDYSKGIHAGLLWLMAQQGADGAFPGPPPHTIYSHGIATIVLCEAYGLTSDPNLKMSAQKALDYIIAYQHSEGGWRYQKGQPGDLSVTGWQLMALKSGQMSGLRVPAATLKAAERFIDSCEDPNNPGGYSYVPGGGRSPAMSATGMLCRQYLGINPRNPKLLKGVDYLKTAPPGRTGDIYYEYYATQVMHHMGGDAWDFWNEGPGGKGSKTGIRDTLIARMEKDPGRPTFVGSWTFGGHAGTGGRIMSTSLALLSLEVYYRHLPLYRNDLGVVK